MASLSHRSTSPLARMHRSSQELSHPDPWMDLEPHHHPPPPPPHSKTRLCAVSGSGHLVLGNASHHSPAAGGAGAGGGGPGGGGGAGGGAGSHLTSSLRCQAAPHLNVSPRPVHKRTVSLKKPRQKAFELEELDEMRPRTSSLPTKNSLRRPNLQYLTPPHASSASYSYSSSYSSAAVAREQDEFYTLRSFITTSKGQLVNRGDSLRSRSTNSIMSSGSGSLTELTRLSQASSQCSLCQQEGAGGGGGGGGGGSGPDSPGPGLSLPCLYRVLMLGGGGVGKSSLTQQFATSEYLGTFGPSIDTYREMSVSLLIDGEESTVNFIDPVVDGDVPDESVDGFVVVFRIDDRGTFSHATDLLYDIRHTRALKSALILVANKCDLVRSREVSTEEAKSVAATYDCKYVETSVVLNHNVDELLVGIVTQMRLLSASRSKSSRKAKHGASSEDAGCYAKSRHFLNKLLFRKYPISKSCENLYVL